MIVLSKTSDTHVATISSEDSLDTNDLDFLIDVALEGDTIPRYFNIGEVPSDILNGFESEGEALEWEQNNILMCKYHPNQGVGITLDNYFGFPDDVNYIVVSSAMTI